MESLEDRRLLSIVSLTPVKDNSLIEYRAATTPYSGGADTSLYLGLDHRAGARMRGLIDFDLAASGIPADATINSVTLTVYVNLIDPGNGPSPVELHPVLANWGEGTFGREQQHATLAAV